MARAAGISVTLRHGHVQSLLFSHVVDVGQVKKVNVRWEQRQLSMDPETICGFFCNKKLYVTGLTITALNVNRKGYRFVVDRR